MLGGTITPNGADTHYWFLYSDGINVFESPTYDAGSRNQQSIGVAVIGLSPNTAYSFEIVASNSAGVSNGSTNSFTTKSSGQIPYVLTGDVSDLTNTSATISGNVNPNGKDTHYWFQYGRSLSLAFASQTSSVDAGSGSTYVNVSANLSGLVTGTYYYYRLRASNSAGTNASSIGIFILNTPPTAVTEAAEVGNGIAFLNAQLNANGEETHYSFLYGTSPTLAGATQTPIMDFGSGVNPNTSYVQVSGLSPATTYYFQVQASNASGTSSGAILSFTTNLPIPSTDFAT